MSKIKNVATITDDKVINVRRAAIEHRGRWAAGFYTEARAQGIDLEPIMRKVIFQQGVDSGKAEAKKFDEVTPKTYGHYFCTKDYNETFEKKILVESTVLIKILLRNSQIWNMLQKASIQGK